MLPFIQIFLQLPGSVPVSRSPVLSSGVGLSLHRPIQLLLDASAPYIVCHIYHTPRRFAVITMTEAPTFRSVFGVDPLDDFTVAVGAWIYHVAQGGHALPEGVDAEIEVEAKIGTLIDSRTGERVSINAVNECSESQLGRKLRISPVVTDRPSRLICRQSYLTRTPSASSLACLKTPIDTTTPCSTPSVKRLHHGRACSTSATMRSTTFSARRPTGGRGYASRGKQRVFVQRRREVW